MPRQQNDTPSLDNGYNERFYGLTREETRAVKAARRAGKAVRS